MNKLKTTISIVTEQQRQHLSNSTFEVRKNYLSHLAELANEMGINEPCQELYDAYTQRASTPDLRFQLFHTIRLIDKEAHTKAFTPEGKLYNEPDIPSSEESEMIFSRLSFPIDDGLINIGHLIRRAEHEMDYLQLSDSTRGQYLKAWRELYIFLYLQDDTSFIRSGCNAFVQDAVTKYQNNELRAWKLKIRRRAVNVLFEVADTGCFKWKLFRLHKTCCHEESLEKLRLQYLDFLFTKNLEKATIDLHDYAFRIMIEGLGIAEASEIGILKPESIQKMLLSISERLNLNSKGTIFPILRQILSYLHKIKLIHSDYSGMIMTPAYQRMHLKPYLNETNEKKLFDAMKDAPLRTKAMMLLALRLGLRDIDICNLRFSQIDWINDRITLEQEKTGVSLCLPLLDDVGNAIMDYIMNERPKAACGIPHVFVRKQAPHKKLSSLYMYCSRLFIKADIKTENRISCGTHACRYTLIHKLLLKKVPHQVITDTLGHVSKESDKPYLSMEEQMLRECPLDLSLIGQKFWEEGAAHA